MKSNKNVIAMVLLIAALGAALVITSKKYFDFEREECFEIVQENTSQIALKIHNDVIRDRQFLRIVSNLAAQYEASQTTELKNVLASFEAYGLMSRVEILFPGDWILTDGGQIINSTGKISFDEEAAQGEHISRRSSDILNEEKMVIRNFVPVKKDDEVIAMLYGVIELQRMKELYSMDTLNGNAQFYIIDGANGDFLMDTWHTNLSNLHSLEDCKVRDGYDQKQFFTDISKGVSGDIVFLSQNAKEYFYSHYMPVGIEQWMVMASVPESAAIERIGRILRISYNLAIFEILVLMAYFIWILLQVRKEAGENKRQLNRVQYMFSVEKLLFDAPLKPERITKALQKIADVTEAERAFFCIVSGQQLSQQYVWESHLLSPTERSKAFDFNHVLTYLIENALYESAFLKFDYWESRNFHGQTGYEALKNTGMRNLMVTPILGAKKDLIGILGVCNIKISRQDPQQLECVSLSFSMVINNMKIYQTVRKMGMVDSLTGLLNRNSYHHAIAELKKNGSRSLACIYFDANGLHEINNHLGHEAGDRMLQCVAENIRAEFTEREAYRIGGDEFVVLCQNKNYAEVLRKAEAIKKAVYESGYCVSSGIEWRGTSLDIDAVIKSAEQKMQQDKRAFYEKKENLRKVREMNDQLDKMIMEKHDADAFLSVISPNFKGVYFVDLGDDSVRHIYIPEYYEKMLHKAEGNFSKAIFLYAKEVVSPEFYQEFQTFCNYEWIEKQLNEGQILKLCYKKINGVWINLRIFKIKKFTDEDKETLWIFEEAEQGEQ